MKRNFFNASGSSGSTDPVSMGIQAAATIATVVSNINDTNKRRLIESNLMLLNNEQKIELAQQIAKQNNRNEQAAILINVILAARNAADERERKAQTVKWILIGAAGVITLGILAWYLKK